MLAIERRGFAANLGAGRKAPCRVATTGNITLSGAQTIDGVAVVADDRVLVKDQTNTIQNAVYVCKTGEWELASDFNQRGDAVRGSLIFVTDGDENAESEWYVATTGRPWPGRQAITFTQLFSDRSNAVVTVGARTFTLTPDSSTSAVKTANTAAIQEAIDYAYEEALQVIKISAGVFYFDPGIYLDAPSNLRSSLSTPSIFAFSMHLQGAGGLFNTEGHGTQLRFTDNSTNALIVGSGRGMRVSDLSIIGPSGATSRAALSANGIGIALSGYMSRCLLDNVGVINFRKGYVTGFNTDVLCDSVTLSKCVAFDCYVGLHVKQTQNYVVSLFGCDFGGNKIHVLSDVAKAVSIVGGNYSTSDGDKTAFTISSVSGLAPFSDTLAGSSFTNATFTAILSSPDQPMADGSYDAFAIDTTAFGPVPLVLSSYDSGTSTATFKFYAGWLLGSGLEASALNGGSLETLLETVLSTATLLYACEQVTTFQGYCFNVDGIHVENPDTLTRFYHATSGFGGDPVSRFNRVTFNHTLDHFSLFSGTNAQKAVAYCQQVFPFIQGIDNADDLRCELSHIVNVATTNRVMIDWYNTAGGRFIVRDCDLRVNLRVPNRAVSFGPTNNDFELATTGYGFGEWDETPFEASADTLRYYARNKFAGIPFVGHFPAPHAQLTISAADLAEVEGSLASVGNYPAIMGRVPYLVTYPTPPESVSGANAARWVESNHQYWSYGQNLTIDWDYVGGSNIVRMDSLTRMFAGLRITLDNGGGDENYVVTGVYPTLGYISVVRWRSGTSATHLAGTYGTDYSGATVKQESYSFSRRGTLPASKFTTNTTSGATTAAQGDLTGADFVNIKLTAVGSTNYTTRTAAQLFSDIPGCYSGYKYTLAVCNVSTGNTVLAAGSNVTVNSTGNIPASSVRMFEVRFTSTAAVTFDGQTSTST